MTAMSWSPTTKQVLERGQATPVRVSGGPKVWRRQVRPPSVLRSIVPLPVSVGCGTMLPPTATQVLGLVQATPVRLSGLPLGWRRQVRPPSVLRTIVPAPTATQRLGLGQATPYR